MDELQELYMEALGTIPQKPITAQDKINKIQGLFNSIYIGLDSLRMDYVHDSEMSELIDEIQTRIYTPAKVFEQAFIKK